jgi:hypothetical protein
MNALNACYRGYHFAEAPFNPRLRIFEPGSRDARSITHWKQRRAVKPDEWHSRKPDELHPIIEACSPGPFLERFARTKRSGWTVWGNQAPDDLDLFTGPDYGKSYSLRVA